MSSGCLALLSLPIRFFRVYVIACIYLFLQFLFDFLGLQYRTEYLNNV